MNQSPLKFTYPLTAILDGQEVGVDALLTFHPGLKETARQEGSPARCVVHSAVITDEVDEFDDLSSHSPSSLLAAAQEAADNDIEAIASEAIARLVIEKENAEVRSALRGRPISQPVVFTDEISPVAQRQPARALAELG